MGPRENLEDIETVLCEPLKRQARFNEQLNYIRFTLAIDCVHKCAPVFVVPMLQFEALIHKYFKKNPLGNSPAFLLDIDHQKVHAFLPCDVFAGIFRSEKLPILLLLFC